MTCSKTARAVTATVKALASFEPTGLTDTPQDAACNLALDFLTVDLINPLIAATGLPILAKSQ